MNKALHMLLELADLLERPYAEHVEDVEGWHLVWTSPERTAEVSLLVNSRGDYYAVNGKHINGGDTLEEIAPFLQRELDDYFGRLEPGS